MRIDRLGKIEENFYVLGHVFTPVYLLDGRQPALFDAGFSALSNLYENDISKVLGSRSPAYLFITHSHWDHVGAAGFFKKKWPEIIIAGSVEMKKVLESEKAVHFISNFSQNSESFMQELGVASVSRKPFKPFHLDYVLAPQEKIELDDHCSVQALATPGHTRDFFSYWIPEKQILIASEAAGTDFGNGVIENEFLIDFDIYLHSLKELAKLDVRILCIGHRLVFTGKDAIVHLKRSYEQAEHYVFMTEKFLLDEDGDIDLATARVKAAELPLIPFPKVPPQAYQFNTRIRVERIWERMQRRDAHFSN